MKEVTIIIFSCKSCMYYIGNNRCKYCKHLEKFLPQGLDDTEIYLKCELMDYKA